MARYEALDLVVDTKADLTPVTEADRAIEETLRARIKRDRGDAVGGEEFGVEEGDVRWWLDPIDGTKQYARGLPIWATLIALERDGAPSVAVASAPALGHRWWATKEGGAFRDGERIHVSAVERVEDAYVSVTSIRGFEAFAPLFARATVARTYPDFWQHMLVAEGRIEVALDSGLNPWDALVPQLVVEEAGGRFEDAGRFQASTNGRVRIELPPA
jgi:histidinol-phosphatase